MMKITSMLWILLTTIWTSGILAFAGEVFVSRFHGSATSNCGLQKSRTCKFLHQAAAHWKAGDIINIDGTGTTRDPYPCESTTMEFQVAGLSFRSYKNRATIACKKNIVRFSCVRKNNSSITVALEGITFLNTGLQLANCALRMKNVYFFNSFFDALSINFAPRMHRKIELIGCLFQNNEANGVTVNGEKVQMEIKNTTFENNKIQNKYHALLNVSGQSPQSEITTNFTDINAVNNTCVGKACFVFSSGNIYNSGLLTLSMKKGNFKNNQAGESVLDIRGNSNIEFKSVLFSKNKGRAINIVDGNSVEFKLMDGNFVRNNMSKVETAREGGAILVSRFKQEALVFISRSNFTSNRGQDGGAFAILDIVSKTMNVNIEHCNFVDNRAQGSGGAVIIGTKHNWQIGGFVTIQNSNFTGNQLNNGGEVGEETATQDPGGGGALALYVQYMGNFTLINNSFVDNIANYRSSGAVRANFFILLSETVIQRCEFLRNKGSGYSGTFELTSTAKNFSAQPRRVSIRNSTFKENKAIGIALQDVHLYHGYVTMSFCKFEGNSAGGIFLAVPSEQCDLRVDNSALTDNKYFEFDVSIKNCSGGNLIFTNTSITRNNCTTKSKMFRVLMYFMNSLIFQSSQIEDNFCFSGVIQVYVTPKIHVPANPVRTEVILNDTIFRGNSGVTKSALEIWDVARVVIHNCTFVDNFGGLDGSHLRVQLSSSVLYVNQTVFQQTEKSQVLHVSKEKPYNGFLTVTSYGDVHMQDTSFTSNPFSLEGKILIFVKGARKVYLKNSVKIQAPEGSKLYFHNFTHLEDIEEAHWITSFSMSYYPCPTGSYSIRRGISTGFAIGDQIECRTCPIGANCSTTLSARPNFWGYPVAGHVRFTLCPQGYCCPTVNQTCRYHNESYRDSGCQGNRTGFLCGRCKTGFSETLFHNRCHPIKDCKDYWYLLLVFICALLFALYLIQKPPLFQQLMRNLTWFLPNEKGKFEFQAFDTEGTDDATGPSTTASCGFLKILFYFYQIAGLLMASSYGVSGVLEKTIVLPLVSLLDFKLYAESDWNICPFPGMTPLSKTASQLTVTMVIHLSIVLIYLLHTGLKKLQKQSPVLPDCAPYLAATLETLLLGYSAVLGTTVRLLDCKTIQHQQRWYYNAEVTCLQWWQKAAEAVFVLHLLPFILTLFIGSIRLYKRQISAKLFLLACVFPLPFLLIVSFSHLLGKVLWKSQATESSRSGLQENTKYSSLCSLESSVFEVLSAPFCDTATHENSSCKVYWESILIGRRFVLILIGSFVAHALLRSVLLAVLCLIFLLHHLSNNPFVNFYANLAETVSLASLVVIAILNVGMASFYSTGAPLQGVQHEYVQGFRLTEGILLGVVPFFFVAFVSLSLASQLVRAALFVAQMARRRLGKSKRSNSKTRNSNHQSDDQDPLLRPM